MSDGFFDPTEVGEVWGLNPSQNMQLQIAAVTWRTETRSHFTFTELLWCLLSLSDDGDDDVDRSDEQLARKEAVTAAAAAAAAADDDDDDQVQVKVAAAVTTTTSSATSNPPPMLRSTNLV